MLQVTCQKLIFRSLVDEKNDFFMGKMRFQKFINEKCLLESRLENEAFQNATGCFILICFQFSRK